MFPLEFSEKSGLKFWGDGFAQSMWKRLAVTVPASPRMQCLCAEQTFPAHQ